MRTLLRKKEQYETENEKRENDECEKKNDGGKGKTK